MRREGKLGVRRRAAGGRGGSGWMWMNGIYEVSVDGTPFILKRWYVAGTGYTWQDLS